jgi:hypothetical protein
MDQKSPPRHKDEGGARGATLLCWRLTARSLWGSTDPHPVTGGPGGAYWTQDRSTSRLRSVFQKGRTLRRSTRSSLGLGGLFVFSITADEYEIDGQYTIGSDCCQACTFGANVAAISQSRTLRYIKHQPRLGNRAYNKPSPQLAPGIPNSFGTQAMGNGRLDL